MGQLTPSLVLGSLATMSLMLGSHFIETTMLGAHIVKKFGFGSRNIVSLIKSRKLQCSAMERRKIGTKRLFQLDTCQHFQLMARLPLNQMLFYKSLRINLGHSMVSLLLMTRYYITDNSKGSYLVHGADGSAKHL